MNQVQVVQKRLENLLEKDPNPAAPRPPFEPQQDLSQIDGLGFGLPLKTKPRAEMIFSRLCVYFESGLLFESGPAGWRAISGFDQGSYFPLRGAEFSIPFQFPQMSLVEVRKVHSPEIFAHLQEIQVVHDDRSQVLIFKPHPDYVFMVTSHWGDPWLKPHIERIQKEILLVLTE